MTSSTTLLLTKHGKVLFFLRLISSTFPNICSIDLYSNFALLFVNSNLLVGMKIWRWSLLFSISLPMLQCCDYRSHLFSMNREQLQICTRKTEHHGLNSQEVLRGFMEYQKIVKEPLLVFRYMEEKAICLFLPQFWLEKAKVHAQLGDYATAFQCIVLARSRVQDNDFDQSDLINKCEKQLRTQMVTDMRKTTVTSKAKRSIAQHGNNLMDDKFIRTGQNQQEMVKLYDNQYGPAREDKQKRTEAKWSKLPLPWMHEYYEKEDAKQEQIQKEIIENSNLKLLKTIRHHSMHTPMVKRDPMRLKNTKNSVQLARQKKETREKKKKNRIQEDFSDSEKQFEAESKSLNMNSLPVGKEFLKRKQRRVTFDKNVILRNEKLRSVEMECSSFRKITSWQSEKMQLEIDKPQNQD